MITNNAMNCTSQTTPKTSSNSEIDLQQLFSVIWRDKLIIILTTVIFAISSVIYAMNLQNTYRAEVLLAPTSNENSGVLASVATQLGGLANMAGINLGGKSGIDKTLLTIEVLKSRRFIAEFIKNHKLLPDLMAVKKWNQVDNTLTYNAELYDSNTRKWTSNILLPGQIEPSAQQAYKTFVGLMSISESKDNGMVTISIEHKSPFVAKQWVDWLVHDINLVMKERDVAEAMRSKEYLNKQIELTSVSDIRSILYKIIEEQTKTIMFAEVRDEYVFKTVDPALVPEEKFRPKRALLVVMVTLFGAIFAVFFVSFRYFLTKS